ncbi:Copper amine oxidase, N2 domain-containing protein [Cladophialophora immunda]|nr:Copper amine oxidase, N2 domain-containing protein [Cladophialophora immunda]
MSSSTEHAAGPSSLHPLDPITANEIEETARLIKSKYAEGAVHFKSISILDPAKKALLPYLAAERAGKSPLPTIPRRTKAVWVLLGSYDCFCASVNLSSQEVEHLTQLDRTGFPNGDVDETREMRLLVPQHPEVKKAIEKLGLPPGTEVVCNTWSYGREDDTQIDRRVQCYMFCKDPTRATDASNHYDFPLPIAPVFENKTKRLVEITYLPTGADVNVNRDPKFVPHKAKEFHHSLQDRPTRTDLKPLIVIQPHGTSFAVEGYLVKWQKWRFRLAFNFREGMVLNDVTYDGRELFHRVSLSEMVVPYADPRSPYHRKSVFDLGDVGAGNSANNLQLGCDCLGVIKYFDFVVSNSKGEAVPKPNAVCMHEIDNGIGYKHTNNRSGLVSITRARVLVLQSILTVGNYDYIFAFHFDQAAGLHYEIKATGIVATQPIDKGVTVPWGTVVNEGVLAPHHQHVFILRIDPNLDGPHNTVVMEDSVPMPLDDELNPYGVGYTVQKMKVTESGSCDFSPNRVFKITNPNSINPVSGLPVAYAIGSPMKQMLLAHPSSQHGRRARFATHPYWVTKYQEGELFAAGNFTYQSIALPLGKATHDGSGDVAAWAARKDPVDNEDIVLWHSISLTHNVRVEDYPIMPCETILVSLKPSGFFEESPLMDVPQSSQLASQSTLYEDPQDRPTNGHSSCSGHEACR